MPVLCFLLYVKEFHTMSIGTEVEYKRDRNSDHRVQFDMKVSHLVMMQPSAYIV